MAYKAHSLTLQKRPVWPTRLTNTHNSYFNANLSHLEGGQGMAARVAAFDVAHVGFRPKPQKFKT